MEYARIFGTFAYLILFYFCTFIFVLNYNSFTLAEKLTMALVVSGFHLLSTLITSSKDS